ncbi:MAG TPA: HAMP domain-containing protein [Anaeromyxobacteraceae bacterium]|nr:HAMP domain-containing protein [Anaeromyxobacteraceae bacterium]
MSAPLAREGSEPVRLGRQSLRFRVYVLVAGGVLAAALVALAAFIRLSQLDDAVMAARRNAVAAAAEHLDEELTSDLEGLQHLASSPEMAAPDDGLDAARDLLRAATLHSELRGVFLVDRDGRVLDEEPRSGRGGADLARLPEIEQTLEDGKPRVTGLVQAGDAMHTYALVPVVDWKGRPRRVVVGIVEFGVPYRARVLGHLLRGEGGYADLLDAGGAVIASTEASRVHRPAACRVRLATLISARRTASETCRACHDSGPRSVTVVAPLPSAPWGVSLVEPEASVLAAAGLPIHFPVLAAGLVLLAGLFAWGAARSVTRPVAVLTDATERIAAGGLDEPVPALGQDELGRLGRSIEGMRASLRDLLAREKSHNELLEQRVDERTRALARVNAELKSRDEQRQRLLRMVITAQEDERKRIARELHDETTQSLAVLAMGIESAAAALRAGGPRPRLEEVKALAVKTLEEVHRLILDLRPAVLDDLGLFSALRWYAERYLAERGIAVRCEIRELERRLPPEIEIALFRIGQEAMNNVLRHAKADSVLIQLGEEGQKLRIEIEDDGQGFDPEVAPADRPHYGLLGIRERAELLGGTAVIESSPGGGTRVEVLVPIPSEGSLGPSSQPGAAQLSSSKTP